MNRRDLLKRLAGIPMLGVLVPAAVATFKGMDLTSGPDETVGFLCVNGHSWCNRCVTPFDLSEAALEDMCKKITERHLGRPVALVPSHVHVRLHELDGLDYCQHCGASAQDIEEGLVPLGCWKRPR